MSDLLPQILTTVQETARLVGELHGRFEAAEAATAERRRTCEDAFRRLEARDEPSLNFITETRASDKTRAAIWGYLVALVGVVAALAAITGFKGCASATLHGPRDAAAPAAARR